MLVVVAEQWAVEEGGVPVAVPAGRWLWLQPRPMRSVARALAPGLKGGGAQRGVHEARRLSASASTPPSTPASDVLSWLGAAAVGGAAVAVVGQPLATPATETPPDTAVSRARDGTTVSAHAVLPQGSSATSSPSGVSDDVWRYDEEGRVLAERDAPADTVETEQLPTWYTEAAQDIAALDAATGPAHPPGSHPWGHLYQVQPGRGARDQSAAPRQMADPVKPEITDVAAVHAPDPIGAAQVEIGDEVAEAEPAVVSAGQTGASIHAAGVDIGGEVPGAEDTVIVAGQTGASADANGEGKGDETREPEVAEIVAGQTDASADVTVVEISDSSAAGDGRAETTQAQLTAPELPVAATTMSASVEESYLMWLRGDSAPAAASESAACVAAPTVQDPLRAGTVQQSPAEPVRTQR
eukprot:COSAG02_NODE_7090_length_3190_cov_22.295697_2_plen_412_part_00